MIRNSAFLAWAGALAGWIVCAFFCLLLTVGLEPWPEAYDTLFPAAMLVLFGNILAFIVIGIRHGASTSRLLGWVLAFCVAEGLLLFLLYLAGRYAIGV